MYLVLHAIVLQPSRESDAERPLERITNGCSGDNRIHAILAVTVVFVLVLSIVSTVATIGLRTAFAEKGGKSGEDGSYDHGKGEKSKARQETNQSSTNSSNSTESDEEQNNGKGKGNRKESHQSMKRSWEEYLNQTANKIHDKHLKMNAGFSGLYTSDLTYTMKANGTADAIGNSTYAGDAQISLDMSVWKSTPGQVKLDVTGGTFTVDGQNMDVHSGHAHYWKNINRMLIVAFVIEGGDNEYNEDASNNNQTSSTNQTSTANTAQSDTEGFSEPQARVLKLWISIPEGSGKLPTDQLADPIQVDVKSQQSKLASMWFLEMSGEVALST